MHPPQHSPVIEHGPLGKATVYPNTYTPSLLFPISRTPKRVELGIEDDLPFTGVDLWNAYEISWLDLRGKPVVAIGTFCVPCESPQIFESKSFKLYLNSLNNSKFSSLAEVSEILTRDLTQCAGAPVQVRLSPLDEIEPTLGRLQGICLDQLEIDCSTYQPDPSTLSVGTERVEESLYTHLLKSNCPITEQPDWGSVEIRYSGKKINHEGLLKYIVSLRDHGEFHEQCVERIFCNIRKYCNPLWLTVYARYTRRGGIDINPYRTNRLEETHPLNTRLPRQ
jgi:7-cyano-7-deazaguanine reductase